MYFALVDPAVAEHDAPAAMLPITLFDSDRVAINRALVAAGAPRMTDGMRIRLRGFVTLYQPRSTCNSA